MPLIQTRAAASAQGFGFTKIAAAVDKLFNYVSLLLTGNGTNGAQNNTFLDSSSNNFTVTRNGNTTQGSFSPFGDTWSNYFDGNGDFLQTPTNTALNFNSSNYTVEAWVYLDMGTFTSFDLAGRGVVSDFLTNNDARWLLGVGSNGKLGIVEQDALGANSVAAEDPNLMPLSQWVYIAAVKEGTSLRLYRNGSLVASATSSVRTNFGGRINIGQTTVDTSYRGFFLGYISNVRLLKGTALYTSNFIPPTAPLTAITNTSLLTCQSNRFIDNSTNNFAITVNGNTSVQKFSPFLPNPNTWSNYFDGSGDELSIASNSAFNILSGGDFTVECWFYARSLPINGLFGSVLVARDNASGSDGWIFRVLPDSLEFVYPGLSANAQSFTFLTNTWYHVAAVRSGTTMRYYVNGTQYSPTYSDRTADVNFPLLVGAENYSGNRAFLNGYISNLRIVKGTAVYTASFTPPTAPLTAITNTQLLTCQNSTIRDNSPNRFPITVNGNVAPNTLSPFLGFSGYFDGAGDFLSSANSTSFDLPADFTLEAWVYCTSTANAANTIAGKWDSAVTNDQFAWVFSVNPSTGVVVFGYGNSGVFVGVVEPVGGVKPFTWQHIAVSRSGSTVKLFVNGTQAGSNYTITSNLTSVSEFRAGRDDATTRYFNGYISNLRIVKGTAVYTANFTPPAVPVLPITNTSLLLNFANAGIQDVAMINDIETVGNAQVSTTQSKFGGGSLSFDGTGDYLVLNPSSPDVYAFGSGDWTIEFWLRLNATQISIIYDGRPVSGVGPTPTIYIGNNYLVYFTNNANRIVGPLLSNNIWYHIAVSKSSGSTRMFVDGVQVGLTYADAVSYTNSASRPIIGASGETLGDGSVNGYIDELRITKGIARYVSNFNPPPAPFKTY